MMLNQSSIRGVALTARSRISSRLLSRCSVCSYSARWSSSSASSEAPPESNPPLKRKKSERKWSTPIAKQIGDVIAAAGPISLHSYMRHCLGADIGGYYTSHGEQGSGEEVFGSKGDFVTSPEISQVFGELVGIWTIAEWISQGSKRKGVQIIELGPGKGTLMADMLRSMRNFKSFTSSVEAIYLIETSPVLRDVQRKLLCGDAPLEEIDIGWKSKSTHIGVPIIWTEHIRMIPEKEERTPFIFAHEFFDALPIHAFQTVEPPKDPQKIMTPTGPTELHAPKPNASQEAKSPKWRELVVSINPESEIEPGKEGKDLEFRLALNPQQTPSSLVVPETSPRYRALKQTVGSTIEVCPEGNLYATQIARMIGGPFPSADRKPSGAALIIDYGPADTVPINSLRGIRKHQRVSPFTTPGLVDLSADVDFTGLAESAIDASPGVEVYGPVEQGAFLQSLGIKERTEMLLRKLKEGDEKRKSIETGVQRLTESGGGGMGRIYKAMTIVPESGGKRRPVGFGGSIM